MGIENPSEYYVSALYSDGFRFNQNKNNFKYLHLFYMIAVSYTHLDVYKRQTTTTNIVIGFFTLNFGIIFLFSLQIGRAHV